jgi:hypothetical protein
MCSKIDRAEMLRVAKEEVRGEALRIVVGEMREEMRGGGMMEVVRREA